MNQTREPKPPYRGRFAPSPSGPLHFGSLVCALASYLDARANQGTWLIRMEDIDPPREQAGAAAGILQTLEAHGMRSDEPVLFQSSRSEAYYEHLQNLLKRGLAYRCNCTRKRLANLQGDYHGNYDGHCLHQPPPAHKPAAIRLNLQACKQCINLNETFQDVIQGVQNETCETKGDFVIHRKDGLFAYQLAVVVDDIAQGISHVVRGADLLETTAQQRLLFRLFSQEPPLYAHIPVMADTAGNKLSKQNHAPAVSNDSPYANLVMALSTLNLHAPTEPRNNIPALLTWATEHWDINKLPRRASIPAPVYTTT